MAPLLLLVDANARLGSVVSAAVGGEGAETQCNSGFYLHQFLVDHELFVPSTMRPGPFSTWQSSVLGAVGHSNDYDALSAAWAALVSQNRSSAWYSA